jgi:Leucine-rich repeat (LRR) protein
MSNTHTTNEIKELTDFLDKYGVDYKVVGDSVVAEEVDLANREITQLPNSIGNLNCKCIDLRNNKITSLPSSFGNLKREYLYLDNNLTLSYIEIFIQILNETKQILRKSC